MTEGITIVVRKEWRDFFWPILTGAFSFLVAFGLRDAIDETIIITTGMDPTKNLITRWLYVVILIFIAFIVVLLVYRYMHLPEERVEAYKKKLPSTSEGDIVIKV